MRGQIIQIEFSFKNSEMISSMYIISVVLYNRENLHNYEPSVENNEQLRHSTNCCIWICTSQSK